MAPAPRAWLSLEGGEREVREQAGVGAEMGSCEGGAPGATEVMSEQAFRENISYFPCLHLLPECREVALLLPASEEEGGGGGNNVHSLGVGQLLVHAAGQGFCKTPQSSPAELPWLEGSPWAGPKWRRERVEEGTRGSRK